jgi:hypothetical protein
MRQTLTLLALASVAALGLYVMASPADASTATATLEAAQLAPGAVPYVPERPRNDPVVCRPIALLNMDAGIGGVLPAGNRDAGQIADFRGINAELESTKATYWCWREGTTRANVTTACRKRCVGCNNGSAYVAEIAMATGNLHCFVADDGGVSAAVEFVK